MPVDPGPAELDRLYNRLQLSYAGIAHRLGCSRAYVGRLMARHGVAARSRSVARKVAVKRGRVEGHVAKGTPEYDAKRRRWKSKHGYSYQKTYRRRHPERVRAHWVVQKAVARGRLARPGACSSCGCECRPEAHHADYSKPYEVEWLCRQCHRGRHEGAD